MTAHYSTCLLVVLACLGVPLDADFVAVSLLTWAKWLWKKASL